MAESTEVISSCLNLMRRLPPKDIENSLAGLLNLVPNATDELLQRVDQVNNPLASLFCVHSHRRGSGAAFAKYLSAVFCVRTGPCLLFFAQRRDKTPSAKGRETKCSQSQSARLTAVCAVRGTC